MEPIKFSKTCYRINNKPEFLISGEFHYFRVPKADWRKRMELLKEAGGNCIATYIPWLLHEPEEGTFKFGGEDNTWDLEGFFQTAREVGLYVIARPGPYQYSELKYDGLPGWLCENYPELRAKNIEGEAFRTSSISYIHPLFLEKAKKWFDQVCPIIARYTVSNGGPVAMVQLDNELIGIHYWMGSLDYNPVSMGFGKSDGRYPNFLRQRYTTAATLNEAYGTSSAAFEDVRPLPMTDSANLFEIRRRKDYLDFYLGTIAEYAQTLKGFVQEHGIDVPLIHNSATPDMNALFCETVAAMGESFLLGSDHYYSLDQTWPQNNPTPQYAINIFCSLETLRLMGFPPSVLEMPSGSLSDWPPITPQDSRTCYFTNLALGMKGVNYYIFTGGPNPPGAGVTADIYDYGAPIGASGEIRPLYHVQKELASFIHERPWLAEAQREHDCRVVLDFEYVRSKYYWKNHGDHLLAGSEAWDFIRQGILSTAFCASLSPVLCNLGSDEWVNDTSTPLIAVSSTSMAADKQMRLVQFLEKGGQLLLTPVIPTLDENLKSCSILLDFLKRPSISQNCNTYPRITVGSIANIFSNGKSYTSDHIPSGAEVLGKDEITGQPIAWEYEPSSKGRVIFLGFRWLQAKREHEEMLKFLLGRLGLKQKVTCSNPNIWTSLRTAGKKSTLFIMNLLSAPMEANISCCLTANRQITQTDYYKLDPMSVKCVDIS